MKYMVVTTDLVNSLVLIHIRNRNLGTSRAPLKNQAHQGTSLFTSNESKECPKGSLWSDIQRVQRW